MRISGVIGGGVGSEVTGSKVRGHRGQKGRGGQGSMGVIGVKGKGYGTKDGDGMEWESVGVWG